MNQLVKSLARKLLSEKQYAQLQGPYRTIRQAALYSDVARRVRNLGTQHYCPICKSYLKQFMPAGVNPRPNALCPVCGSLERHRLIYLFLQQETDLFLPPRKRMLHVAPEGCLVALLKRSPYIEYVSADIAPYAMVQMDLTDIPFSDESFDVIYISHVFEHILDDRRAMREVHRVLRSGGWSILQVPINSETTYEDLSITQPEERERVFGQNDHVRIYGNDYYDRLAEAGFSVAKRALNLQSDSEVARLGISPTEKVTFCTKT